MIARPSVGAAVDLGSNSVHLLVGSIAGHRVRPLVDESVFLGLGAAVDANGELGPDTRGRLFALLSRYAAVARNLGASHVSFLGTEPIRRAADRPAIIEGIRQATDVDLDILSHEEEAFLTLVGVTGGRLVTRETLVVDIGGGSSEFCAVARDGLARAAGVRVGSNRLTTDHVTHDPATLAEVDAMRRSAAAAVRDALPAAPSDMVIVGGTASNLLKVTRAGSADPVMTADRLREALETLAAADMATTAERFGLNQTRARILPAGAVIVEALLARYGAASVRVSEAGIREGTILLVDHAGTSWRDQLASLAHGWRV